MVKCFSENESIPIATASSSPLPENGKKLPCSVPSIEHDTSVSKILPTVDWAKKIVIPTRFSRETSTGLESGRITRKARDEIINSLSTLILVYTIHPMPDDYNIVCRNLVKKHPILKDHIGSGYDSWKKKLRMKFKNLRRPVRAEKIGITVPFREKEKASTSALDMAEYEKHIKQIKKCYSSQKWSITNMAILLEETASQRRKWILEKCPPVTEVIESFPCLKEPKLIIKEFCNLSGITEDDITQRWADAERRIFQYASFEDKRLVKSLLGQYSAFIGERSADCTTSFAILLLLAILRHRTSGKATILNTFTGESIDIEDSMKTIEQQTPYIVAFGRSLNEVTDIKLVIESINIIPISSVSLALHCCFASYYIYNISYPTDNNGFFLFMEQYVYQLKPSKKLPLSASLLVDSLSKLL